MNQTRILTIILLSVMAASLVLTGCSSRFVSSGGETSPTATTPTTAVQSASQMRSNAEGAVTIDLGWDGRKAELLRFSVIMNTHSVNLDQYDLSKLAVLRDDTGKEYQPLSWQAPAGGHHRSGAITFPLPDSISQGAAKFFEILIRDVDGIKERVFRWEL